jgi:hypothetical protein
MASTVVYSEDYTGPRYWYAATLRPITGFFCAPEGSIVGTLCHPAGYPHGCLAWPQLLGADVAEHYGLTLLCSDPTGRAGGPV